MATWLLAGVFGLLTSPLAARAQSSNAWNYYKGSVWQSTNVWTGGSYPNGPGAVANLGAAITQDSTIRLGANAQLGSLIISNGNTYKVTGLYNLQFSALGPGNGTISLNSSSGSALVSSKLDLLNNLVITQASSGTLTLQGDINVAQKSLTKYGTGTLELDGINSFGNGLYVNQGTVRGFMEENLGNGTNVTLNGGTLSIGGNIKTDGTRVYTIGANGGTLSVDAGVTMDFANGTLLSGNNSSTLTKDGAGTLTLETDNSSTFHGNIDIVAGTLQVSQDNNFGSSSQTVTIDGGTLEVSGTFNIPTNRSFVMGANGGTMNIDANQTLTMNNDTNLFGSGNMTKAGDGTLTLGGNNSGFTGTNIISAGTVKISAENNLGAVSDSVILNGGTLEIAGTFTNNNSKALILQNDSTLTIDSGFTNTFAGTSQIKGANTLTKDGAGTVYVTGNQNSTWTGGLVVSNGTFAFGLANGSATGLTNVTVNSGATLLLDNKSVRNNNRLAGTITLAGGTMHLTGSGGNGGNATSETVGALTLTEGSSTVEVDRNNGTATLTFASLTQAAANATVDFENVGNGTLGSGANIAFTTTPTISNGIIGGWATARSSSSGTLEFATTSSHNIVAKSSAWDTGSETTWSAITNARPTSAQSMTANRSVYSLTLVSGVADLNLGGHKLTDVSGGIIAQGSMVISNGTLTAGSSGVGGTVYFHVQNGATLTEAANITDNGGGTVSLVKANSGTLLLTGSGNYSGTTYVNAGTLMLGSANRLPNSAGLVVESGSTFDMNGFNETVGSIAGAGTIATSGGNLVTGGDDTSTTFSGSISGAGGLTQNGAGTLTLSGVNTYSGGTTIKAGTISVSQDANLGDGSGDITLNGGTLNVSEGFTADVGRKLRLTGNGTVDINDGQTLTFTPTASIAGSGDLTKSGNGTLVLGGGNSYSGNWIINGGEVEVMGTQSAVDGLLTTNLVSNVSGTGGTLTWAYSNNNFTNTINLQPSSPSNIKLGFDNTSANSNVWYIVGPSTTTNLNWAGLVVKGGNVQLSSDHNFVGTSSTTLEVQGGSLYLAGGTSTGGKTLTVSGDVTLTGGTIYGGPGGGSHGTIVTAGNVISDGTVLINGPSLEMQPGSGLTTVVGGTTPLNGVYTFTVNGPGTVRLDQSMSVSSGLSINQGTLLLGASDRLNDDVHITMANGTTFATGGHQDTVGQLTLSGNAYLDLGTGTSSLLAFADSSGQNWGSYTLTITNYSDWAEYVYFGTTSGGLTTNQLSQIVWDDPFGTGSGVYDGAYIDSDGRIRPLAVPEPRTIAAVLLLATCIVFRERRRIARCFRSRLAHFQ